MSVISVERALCPKCGTLQPRDEWPTYPDGKYRRTCRECKRAKDREYAARTAEKRRKVSSAWIKAHPEVNRSRVKAWQKKNPEKARETRRAWYKNNPEKVHASNRASYLRNKDVHFAKAARYRARKREAECGCVDKSFRQTLIRAYGASCFYCGGSYEHTDHFVPLAGGGMNCISNLVPSCANCNLSKKAKQVEDWTGWNGKSPTLECPSKR